ncbi:type II and III secretion system protein family protein [Sporomusa acidovorans]|uniref:Type 3 secretion system secretin n=1 Tax=Sporomusa acidovorans (strain ATCC 49682 / DSM 3132 / Mol) TaxID=1123286 RepID=A0ABZ3IWR9_SPOA4|nr:pilus assembly protein N-terminal domain-containing protein [Sporomusa acidovorans]OZC13980.1 type II secretion system protein D precursor [Sporomusa acidovorans DSM 3132]SDF21695.1 pilus assembly protein CpaC [Sporomusa acidovorans]
MDKWKVVVAVVVIIAGMVATGMVAGAEEKMAVAVNQSRVLNFSAVEKVAIANPEIADVVVVSGLEVLLIGKAPGMTTLHVWSRGGRYSYLVEVGAADITIANDIKNILGLADITVSKVNKTVILEGTVNDQYQKSRAEKVASAYAEKVVNLLEITRPVQVRIEARVVEINREAAKSFGIKWSGDSIGTAGNFSFGQSSVNSLAPKAFGNLGTYSPVNAQLDALVKNGLAKILSQPNMITLSGDKANIMVGGQIPVPVGLSDGRISIEWKDYGIKLDIAPEVNADKLIQSKIKAEVSTLDWTDEHKIELGLGMKIPPIKIRKAETAIALSSGQTMAIGGLISSEVTKDVYKVPLLGDIPVIGNLFKSTAFSRGETEVIIFITPTLVNPDEYIPAQSQDMRDFAKENPFRG